MPRKVLDKPQESDKRTRNNHTPRHKLKVRGGVERGLPSTRRAFVLVVCSAVCRSSATLYAAPRQRRARIVQGVA